jgi:D-alanyl-D-alanine carboxypeptidase/D-alanyl-D-alanine-endopeptidase (penicillin-binding protein 4)
MRYLSFILLVCCIQNVLAQSTEHKLQSIVDRQLGYSEFDHANVTLTLLDIESKKILASHRPDKVLVPASSLKLLTTLTGIKILGSEFKFKTGLYYSGSIDDQGVLNGDLIIVGGGDPTLGSSSYDGYPNFNALLASIVNAVKNQNINCINGLVIVDESVFDSYPIAPTWQWNDLGNYYASGAWGINVNENQYFIHFSNRDIIGRQPKISSIYPNVPQLKLSNEVLVDSAGTGDQAYIFGGPYNYDKRIVGTIPQGSTRFTIKGSIPDPPTFLAFHVRRSLELDNIQSAGSKSVFLPYNKKKQLIKEYDSPPLKKIVIRANEKSDNLYTEAILKIIGLKKRGQGSGQNGINIVKKQMKKYGVQPKNVLLHDGSGLSARNNISSQAMATFLTNIAKEENIDSVTQYIPKAGINGTVRGMLKGSRAVGHVWLKSGSMEGIQSYSGYIQGKSGRWMSFCVIVNGFSVESSVIRSRLDKLIRDVYTSS